jgi:hypothetical protein
MFFSLVATIKDCSYTGGGKQFQTVLLVKIFAFRGIN